MKMKWKSRSIFLLGVMMIFLSACSVIREDTAEKIRDMDFTVLPEEEIPEEFLEFILDKNGEPFKFTYKTEEYLYIAVGYGEQPTGGYSIAVNEFYLTENAIMLDTELIGPSVSEDQLLTPSYPFIVIKTEKMEQPVIFR